jgi:hypothetical protein
MIVFSIFPRMQNFQILADQQELVLEVPQTNPEKALTEACNLQRLQ